MQLKYECSDGTVINLMQNPIFAQEPETLINSSWKYNTISAVNNMAKVKNFYKDVQETPLKLSIMADTAEEFNSINSLLHSCFERDIRNSKPGKICWNDFYKEVFVVETSNDEFEEYFESVEKSLKLLSLYPFWIKKSTTRYPVLTGHSGLLDFPKDYGFDYDMSHSSEILNNKSISEANFELIFYGPAENPSITINGNEYELFTSLDSGEYAIVDSVNKKIKQISVNGDETNIFHLRNRDSDVFKKIPEGINHISRNKNYGIDITIIDERGEPEWI